MISSFWLYEMKSNKNEVINFDQPNCITFADKKDFSDSKKTQNRLCNHR